MRKMIMGILLIFMTGCTLNQPQNNGQAPSASPTETHNTSEQQQQAVDQTKPGDVIATFSTKLIDKKKERVNNIKIATTMLQNVSVAKGETFSFNDTVGERSKENGYQKAYVFIGEEKTLGYGGGICQISSTVYNAAMEAGLEIVERHPHEKPVDYVAKGKDATVSYGSEDLKIKNTKPYPVLIHVRTDANSISADIIRK